MDLLWEGEWEEEEECFLRNLYLGIYRDSPGVVLNLHSKEKVCAAVYADNQLRRRLHELALYLARKVHSMRKLNGG
jgi:hypothetical protein